MIKILRVLIFGIILFSSFFIISPPVFAENAVSILDDSVDIYFPGALVFKLKAISNDELIDIRLNYTVNKMNFAPVISEAWPSFSPSSNIDTQWIWDMRRSSLPPGAEIEYWWNIKQKGDLEYKTQAKKISFNDNNHSWRSITSSNLTILWYDGDSKFAEELLASAKDSLDRLTKDTGAALEEPIKIYIYSSSRDLQQSMISPREWTGGVAFTNFGIIAIGINPNNLEWGKNALAHELGHAAVHQITYSPYARSLPTWLDEGLAMHAEISKDPYITSILRKAVDNNSLLSLRSLCSPFSAITQEALLSYAQSQSVVEYMIQEYGRDKMLSLLITFKEGSSYDEALMKVYGFDLNGLENQWIKSLKMKPFAKIDFSEKSTISYSAFDILNLTKHFNTIALFQGN